MLGRQLSLSVSFLFHESYTSPVSTGIKWCDLEVEREREGERTMARGRMMRTRNLGDTIVEGSLLEAHKHVSTMRKRPRSCAFEDTHDIDIASKKFKVEGEMRERMLALGILETEMVRRLLLDGAIVKGDSGLGRGVREVLVDWMMEVAGEYEVRASTVAVAVAYLDRVVRVMEVERREDLQLVAVVCVLLACKMEEGEAPSIGDVVFICDGLYGRRRVLDMEQRVVRKLDYCMLVRTPLHVLKALGRAMGICEGVVEFVGRFALMEERVARFGVGVVTVACLVVAGMVCGKVWTVGGTVGDVVDLIWKSWERIWAMHHRLDVSRWLLINWPQMAEKVQSVAKERKAG